VGNGPGLRIEGMGEIIDKHDAVYRFNAYNLGPREGKMQDDNSWWGCTRVFRAALTLFHALFIPLHVKFS
jgi:hypothetical protein